MIAAKGRADAIAFTRYAAPVNVNLQNVYASTGHLSSVVSEGEPWLEHWRREGTDAAGRITVERRGRVTNDLSNRPGVYVQRTFTNRHLPATIYTNNAATNVGLQYQTYEFDPVKNVTLRTWWDGTVMRSEGFQHDQQNRLTNVTGASTKTYGYDIVGNVRTKDGLTYTYPATGGARPNTLSSITGTLNGVVNPSFQYDAAGNLLRECPGGNCTAPSRTMTWTTAGLPSQIARGSTATLNFIHDADQSRVRQIATVSGVTTTSYYGLGGLERTDTGGVTTYKIYTSFGIISVASNGVRSYRYQIFDHLGSASLSFDAAANAASTTSVERVGFDAWGKRRNVNGTDNAAATGADRRGYTMHEHLASVSMIHMNGRVYDPSMARFMSTDPIVPSPANAQSFNPYSYVMNNPLKYTDPSGLSSWTEFRNDMMPIVAMAIGAYTGYWIGEAFSVAAGAAGTQAGVSTVAWYGSSAYSAGLGGAVGTASPLGLAVAGAAGGGVSSYIGSHGDWGAAGRGALAGGVFGLVGGLGVAGGWSTPAYTLAHAAVGCVSGALSDDGCATGALSAAAGKFVTLELGGGPIGAIVGGGVGAWAGGGRFGHGAYLAALGYAFNCGLSQGACLNGPRRDSLFSRDPYHSYEEYSFICDTAQTGCTRDSVFEKLRVFPTPGEPIAGGVQTGQVTKISAWQVSHVVDSDNYAVFNITVPGQHGFDPGYVYRNVQEYGGKIFIQTYGEGTGGYRGLNMGFTKADGWQLYDGRIRDAILGVK